MIWIGIVLFFVVLPVATAYQSGRIALILPVMLVLVCVQWTLVGDSGGTATACLVLALVGLAGGVYTAELGRRRGRRTG